MMSKPIQECLNILLRRPSFCPLAQNFLPQHLQPLPLLLSIFAERSQKHVSRFRAERIERARGGVACATNRPKAMPGAHLEEFI